MTIIKLFIKYLHQKVNSFISIANEVISQTI